MPRKRPVNRRLGTYHPHSGEYECGMAYVAGRGTYYGASWHPCSKLVNHEGKCGDEDNSAH